jgi:hypothetical protein
MLAMTATLGWGQAQPALPARPGFPAPGAGLGSANIELTVYLVSGLAQPQGGAATAADVPDDLSATLNQMRGVFAYKSYKLMSAFTLRGRSGSAVEIAGELPVNNWSYDFKYRNAIVYQTTPDVVHITGLRLEISRRGPTLARAGGEPGATKGSPAVFVSQPVVLVSTDVDLKEGQKTVVGQSAVNGTDALFLVIVPKVIEQ